MLHVSVLLVFEGSHYSRAAFNSLRASIVRLLFVGCDYSRAASIRRSTADVSMTSSGMVRIPSGDHLIKSVNQADRKYQRHTTSILHGGCGSTTRCDSRRSLVVD